MVISRSVKKQYWDQKSWHGIQMRQTKSSACLEQSTTLYRMDWTVGQHFCSVLFEFSSLQRQRVKSAYSSALRALLSLVCTWSLSCVVYFIPLQLLALLLTGNCWIFLCAFLFSLHVYLTYVSDIVIYLILYLSCFPSTMILTCTHVALWTHNLMLLVLSSSG